MSYYNRQEYLTPDAIQKYQKRDVKWLKNKAQETFNKWVRERDRDGEYFTCISCNQTKRILGDQYHCGHYHSVGSYSALRFDPQNAHGQCKHCNYFLSGNLLNYRENLIKKIGQGGFEELLWRSAQSKRKVKKWDRFALIEVIEKYKT